jgi:hypothetical protein
LNKGRLTRLPHHFDLRHVFEFSVFLVLKDRCDMWLVLCSSSDAAALWAYQGLTQLGLAPLHLVTAESLACGRRWEHRVDSNASEVKITLSNGQEIESAEIRGVLNRLHAPSEFTSLRAVPSDRAYAQAELLAFYLSWLHALPGVVINRPSPQGLSGPWLHASEWTLRASRAGLRTCAYRQSSHDAANGPQPSPCRSFSRERAMARSVIALHGQIFGGALPAGVEKACSRLAADVETEMLGIELNPCGNREWAFANASPAPDLRLGGAPLLARLAQLLMEGERR